MSSSKREHYRDAFLRGARKFRVNRKDESLVIRDYLSALDCPRALTAWLLFSSGEHQQLASLGFDPENYNGLEAVRSAYAATKFLSKFKGLSLNYDLEQVALKEFQFFEELCAQTNRKFENLAADPHFKGSVVHTHNGCVRKIASILGDWKADELIKYPDWGPGATTLIKRMDASPSEKFQCETGITRDLYALLPIDLLRVAFPLWADHLESVNFPNFQIGDKVVTVTKDAKTNRVINIQPGINLFFQKAAGEMIRLRNLCVGVDTKDQSKNQRAARLGSISLKTATLDLRSASASIATGLVREVLPPRWFSLLDALRVQYGMLGGKVVKWHKFSGMGNGFTFPLQSLIFYAMCYSCCEYVGADVSLIRVYGDDIIIPVEAVEQFSALMSFYNFHLNETKSFINSQFRESCGAHYYAGVDVKPIYLKDRVSSLLSVYKLGNAIRRLSHSWAGGLGCDERFRTAHNRLIKLIPKVFRLMIPDGYGDGGFISNFDEATPRRARFGVEGYHIRTFSLRSSKVTDERFGYELAELWSIDARCPQIEYNVMPPRLLALRDFRAIPSTNKARKNLIDSSVLSLECSKSLVPQWGNLGPWIKFPIGRPSLC